MRNFFWPVLAACVVGVIGVLAFSFRPTPRTLDNFGPAPRLVLTDSNGNKVDSSELVGQVWVMNFFFSSCPNTCPIINGKMAALDREFAHSDHVQLFSITIDPETDTQAHLHEYARKFEGASPHWRFLTGSLDEIRSLLIDGLHLSTGEDLSLHSTRVVLVDRKGDIRGYYQGMEQDSMHALAEDIRALLIR